MEIELLYQGSKIFLKLDGTGWWIDWLDFVDYPLPPGYPDTELDRAVYIFMTSRLWKPLHCSLGD